MKESSSVRLKKALDLRNLKQVDVVEKTGISKSLLSMYINGKAEPRQNNIHKLAKLLNVNETWLMGYDVPMEKESQVKLTSNAVILDKSQFIYVPVYGKASAGNGYINMETVLYDKLIHINGYSHDSFLIEVSGDSMEPTISDGEYVLVDPTSIEICEGKIYVITYNNETYIKMIEKHEEDEIVLLKSINQKYRDKVIKKEEFENVKIEGRVVKVISERNL